MSRQALVLAALTIAAAAPGVRAEVFSFVSPKPFEMVVGPTTVRFAVAPKAPRPERIDVFLNGRLLGSATPPDWSLRIDVPFEDAGGVLLAVAFADGKAIGRTSIRTKEIATATAEVDVVRVPLYVSATTRHGEDVAGLESKDFELLEDGKPRPMVGCTREKPPLTLALVLDVSGSMTERLDLVQHAAREFLQRFAPEDKISLYAFNEGLRRLSPPTTDRAALAAAITDLEAGGGTSLYDAALDVLEDLSSVPGRKAIFIFSDGRDELSIALLTDVVDAARRSDALIYSVAAPEEDKKARGREDLARLAKTSGGQAVVIQKLKDIRPAFERVAADLGAQYVVTFVPAPGPAAVRTLSLRPNRDDLVVRTRTEYYHSASR